MQYVGKVFSTVSQLYKELNPATLSGAIDVVVVEGADGELHCSPFHVRFGKLQLLRPSDKAVQVIVNDRPAPFYMKVGDSGEGFFVLETDSDVPSQFATSPVASPALSFREDSDPGEPDFLDLSGNVQLNELQDGYVSAHESDISSPPESASRLPFIDDMAITTGVLHQLNDKPLGSHYHPRRRRSLGALSDSELVRDREQLSESRQLRESQQDSDVLHTDWDWGVKPAVSAKASAEAEPEPAVTSSPSLLDIAVALRPESCIELSQCGLEVLCAATTAQEQRQAFEDMLVHSNSEDSYMPVIVDMPNLVICINHSVYVRRDVFVQAMLSHLAFGQASHVDTTGIVATIAEPAEDIQRQRSSSLESQADAAANKAAKETLQGEGAVKSKPGRRWWRWGQRSGTSSAGDLATTTAAVANSDSSEPATSLLEDRVSEAPMLGDEGGSGYLSDDGQVTHIIKQPQYAKTLRLTSDQLKSLNLRQGANDVKFLVPSNSAYCEARIFLYRHNTQIVISDIDGTITKSDALGHLFNMVGKDWTHHGVAKLYTDIANNGYEILYLTSRAIGQADGTRYFINNVKQGSYKLPLGPLLLSPDRLFTSFHREVIMRRPHEFKMACLRDIKNLFGSSCSPFYAGFGNRISDAMSYRSVNVPVSRICTIDSSGEIKLDLLPGYKSSYVGMNDLVDMMFPALSSKLDPKFNDWEYWKPSMPSIDDELAELDRELMELDAAKRKSDKKNSAASPSGPPPVSSTAAATTSAIHDARMSPPLMAMPTAAAALSTPDLLARQRSDSWSIGSPTPLPASFSEAATIIDATSKLSNSSNTGSGGRMSILKKATAFSPFSLVRGSSPSVQSQPAPKFTFERSNTVNKMAADQNASSKVSEDSSNAEPTHLSPQSIEKDDDLVVAEDPAIAEAASRLVPQVGSLHRANSNNGRPPAASMRVNSSVSFQSQYSEDYPLSVMSNEDDEDDEDIDQETLAIMYDMEEVQRL
ncbi:lipin Ned1 [Coemansia sp. RSA 1250]|nr:lipin Ned1 [Coemansia sp. RSA 1250]